LNTNARVAVIFSVAFVAIIAVVVAITFLLREPPVVPETNPETSLPSTLRDDTHVLNEGSTDVVLVEFLDFEC
jgi:hypothetical protein